MSDMRHRLSAAVYGIFRENGKVLFVKRANTGYMDGKFGLPSGHVEKNESLQGALAREIQEEVGVRIAQDDTEFKFVGHRYQPSGEHDYADFYFDITNWEGDFINNEPEKHSELAWINLSDPDESADVIDYLKVIFQEISEGKNYSSVFRNDG